MGPGAKKNTRCPLLLLRRECLLALGDMRKLVRGRPPRASGRQSALSVGGRRSQLTVVRRELPLLKHRFSQLLLVHLGFSSRLARLAMLASLPLLSQSQRPKENIEIDISAKKRKKNLPSRAESRNHVLECPPVGGHGSTRRCVQKISSPGGEGQFREGVRREAGRAPRDQVQTLS